MLTRREALKRSLLGAAGFAVAGLPRAVAASAQAGFRSTLPLPRTAVPQADGAYKLTLRRVPHRWHPKLPVATQWGYDDGQGGSTPGPTFEVTRGTGVDVLVYRNELGPEHLLAGSVDPGIMHGDMGSMPFVRGQTHLHGGFIPGSVDGNPYATHDVELFQEQHVAYPNRQRAAMAWYHDHGHSITRLNVYAGLFGLYVIRDAFDTGRIGNPLGLPAGPYELPLVIQDRVFDPASGQAVYPPAPWTPEFFGDTICVNGAVEPTHAVEARKYRLRFLNGSNARFYHLELDAGRDEPLPMWQIGSDGGYFDRALPVRSVLLAPAERADVIVDFGRLPLGARLRVRNRALPGGVVSPAPPVEAVMEFVVRAAAGKDSAPVGAVSAALGRACREPGNRMPDFTPRDVGARTRNITLEEVDLNGMPMPLLNGKGFHAMAGGERAVDERPAAGSVEEWRFVNMTPDSHPIHLHLVQFQIAERWTFDAAAYESDLDAARATDDAPEGNPDVALHNPQVSARRQDVALNPLAPRYAPAPVALGPSDAGWKDTVRVDPGTITVIRARFDPAPGSSGATDRRYVYHCHILEHEDHDMMRPYELA